MYVLLVLLVIVVAWSLWGYFSSRVEHTAYTVVKREAGYEIRLYPAHIVAETVVQGSYRDALTQGFRIVAGYIFGGNSSKARIAMTSPVVEEKSAGEKIAMTSPVVASIEGESHTIAFAMPRSYTLETLPTPTDSRVKLVTLPERTVAAIRFSGMRTSGRVELKKEKLLDALKRDKCMVVGEPQYAGYDAPWTPPWMARNEILVEIRS